MNIYPLPWAKKCVSVDGIVAENVENTIRNVGKLARNGMYETNKEIIRIMTQIK